MDRIGAGARGDVDDASVEAAKLRGRVAGFDRELFDVVEDGEESNLAGFGLQRGDAIVEIFVGAWAAAVDAGKKRAGGSSTPGARVESWMKLRELSGIASTLVPGMLVSMVLVSACSSGASVLTVMVSRSPRMVWPRRTVIPVRCRCWKLAAVASME